MRWRPQRAGWHIVGTTVCLFATHSKCVAAQSPDGSVPSEEAAAVTVPFAQAALWASGLPELRKCDRGVDDTPDGCPARPEHGGAGFLSSVFTWRYALNNLRGALIAAAAGHGGPLAPAPPPGASETVLQVLGALDQLMEQPVLPAFAEVVRVARALLDACRPFLYAQPPLRARLPPSRGQPLHWVWPSDGRTQVGHAIFVLRTGARMPAIGFGTWRLWAKQAYQPVRWALEAGYRHIDTAEGYANEAEIGQAIRDSGVPRSEVFIATKASSIPKGLTEFVHFEEVFSMQLMQLGTDYVDMYMLHTPPQDMTQLSTIWSAMESLFDQGRARALGISNCNVEELRFLLATARVPPAYVQNLFKVYKPGDQMPSKEDIVALSQANQIVVMGYSVQTEWPHVLPPLEDPHVLSLASSIGRTPSQVLHRWSLQRGVGVIPKSASQERILENARLLDFELSEDAMRLLDGIATLSESGAAELRPASHQDVYGLAVLSSASSFGDSPAMPDAVVEDGLPWGSTPDHGSPELLARTRDQGFPYAAVRDHILGPGANLSPGACQQSCLADPRCAAWEVCSPYSPQDGCEGCYLIGSASVVPTRVPGWHAAVERGAV